MTLVHFCLLRNRPTCFILFFNQNHFGLFLFCFCFRCRPVGIHCVTCNWLCSATAPGYWDFAALYQKKTTPQEVYYKSLFHSVSLLFCIQTQLRITHHVCVFFSGASNPPQDNSTPCLGPVAREAVHVLGPHISASLFLWSRQQLRPASLWLLHRQDHMLQRWNQAGPCQT